MAHTSLRFVCAALIGFSAQAQTLLGQDSIVSSTTMLSPANNKFSLQSGSNSSAIFSSPDTHTLFLPLDASDESERAKQTASDLLRLIQRGAAQGVIKVDPPQPPGTMPATPQEVVEPRDTKEDVTQTPRVAKGHVSMQTVFDRDSSTMAGTLSRYIQPDCGPPEWYDPNSWGENADRFDVGNLRARLTGEFDQLSQETARTLVYRYLYYGFGAEASHIAKTYEIDWSGTELPTVLEIATLLDGGALSAPSHIAGQASCGGAAQLWAILASPILVADPDFETREILVALSSLPHHLRELLGPQLASIFADHDRADDASVALAAVNRLLEHANDAVRFAEVELASSAQSAQPTAPAYQEIVSEDGPKAAEALIRLIEASIAQSEPIDPSLAPAADAMAVEHRGTAMEVALTRAAILAFAASGMAAEALARLDEAMGKAVFSEDEAQSLRDEIFMRLAQLSDNEAFLRVVYANNLRESNPEPELTETEIRAREMVASRLVSLGLFKRAQNVLADVDPSVSQSIAVTKAQIALASGETGSALELITEHSTTPHLLLTARAREMQGDLAAATLLFSEAEDAYNSERLAWLASDWERVGTSDDAIRSRAAQYFQSASDPNTAHSASEPGLILQLNRNLLSRGEETRSVVSELLGQFE